MGVLSIVCHLLRTPIHTSAFFSRWVPSQSPCILTTSLFPNRLIPILVNGMKYSEIDIILLKVSQGASTADCGWPRPLGIGLEVSSQC